MAEEIPYQDEGTDDPAVLLPQPRPTETKEVEVPSVDPRWANPAKSDIEGTPSSATTPPTTTPPTTTLPIPAELPTITTREYPYSPELLQMPHGQTGPEGQGQIHNTYQTPEERMRQIRKEIHWDQMGSMFAGDKVVNFFLDLGMYSTELTRGGMGLVGNIKDIRQTMLSDEDPDVRELAPEVIDLRSEVGHTKFTTYIANGWLLIPEIVEQIAAKIPTYTDISKLPPTAEFPETVDEDKGILSALRNQFGGLIPQDPLFADIDTDLILRTAYNEVIDSYFKELSSRAKYLVVDPIANAGESGVTKIGFVLSFDGTSFGEVDSVIDLFSGGHFGPGNSTQHLQRLATSDPNKFLQFQQELYAMGFLEAPAVWGQLTPAGADPTINAFHDLQIAMLGEDMRARTANYVYSPDQVRANIIRQRSEQAADFAVTSDVVSRDFANRVQTIAAETIRDMGHDLNQRGSRKLEAGIQKMMDALSPEESESLFSGGGIMEQTQIAKDALAAFYGTDDWSGLVSFGPRDTRRSYLEYSRLVGAISDEEFARLSSITPTEGEDYQDYGMRQRTGTIERVGEDLSDARHDVAVSNFISGLIGTGAEGTITERDVENALVRYAHTVGSKQQAETGAMDYGGMARQAWEGRRMFADPMFEGYAAGVVEDMGIKRTPTDAVLNIISRGLGGSGTQVPRSRFQNV